MKSTLLRLAAIGLAVAFAVNGCDRKPRLVPRSAADSTSASGLDSVTILARTASQEWESGQPDQAAAVSARAGSSTRWASPPRWPAAATRWW